MINRLSYSRLGNISFIALVTISYFVPRSLRSLVTKYDIVSRAIKLISPRLSYDNLYIYKLYIYISVKRLDLDDRIDSLATKDSFITLKDHKPNFNNNPTCRLINPSKSEIGIISKQILQRINAAVLEHINVNQWKNTDSVISWFSNLSNKSTRSFINFDIVDFYPSISEELLCEALSFASNYVPITDNEKNIIIQAKSSVLFSQNNTWCKETSSSLFDVTMGSFDGAETCELVGLYLLSKLPPEYSTEVGLYRDDGLAALDKSPKEIENIKKHICKIFNDHNLKLTIEANKKCVNFLDITLDLRSASYKPYMKPGNTPQYVHRNSNHPPSILRSVPEAINKRLSNISSDKNAFDSAVPPYQEALQKSGYNFKLQYNPQPSKPKRSRSRNIIWFNPPYNSTVSTNIGYKFLQAVDDCFTPDHPLRKIFNRNTLKLSYSCMPNVKSIISSHNKSVLKDQSVTSASQVDKDCNCRKKDTCPLSGKCLTTNVVYQATVTRDDTNEQETYVGHTECQFKTRYNGHTSSFRNAKYKHATELSKHVWNLNNKNVKYSIKWRVLARCNSYSNKTKRCHLCLHEKYIIIYHPKLASLNSRNELLSKCRHRNKFLLSYK